MTQFTCIKHHFKIRSGCWEALFQKSHYRGFPATGLFPSLDDSAKEWLKFIIHHQIHLPGLLGDPICLVRPGLRWFVRFTINVEIAKLIMIESFRPR